MEDQEHPSGRRPLKSRATSWAGGLSGLLVRVEISPNAISVWSVVFSFAAAAVFFGISEDKLSRWWFLAAAALIQLRLICNLMDGMVAIEGGKKSATGDLFNEIPDRIADVIILASLGLCALAQPWGLHMGWLGAALAVMTAYVRMQGAVLTGAHDFRGPMAKPQRMALVTLTCLFCAISRNSIDWIILALLTMVTLEIVTLWRRLQLIVKHLKARNVR